MLWIFEILRGPALEFRDLSQDFRGIFEAEVVYATSEAFKNAIGLIKTLDLTPPVSNWAVHKGER